VHELNDGTGRLKAVGVLVSGRDAITFRGYFGEQVVEREWLGYIRRGLDALGMTPDEIHRYYLERSNGVTVSVSKPEEITARGIDDAASIALAKRQKQLRPDLE
jgi:hypothetical protein